MLNLPVSFHYSLIFEGGEDAAFQEVTGIGKEMNLEEVASGGENRFKYRLPTVTSFQNLVLKRGVVLENSPLIKWVGNTLNEGLSKAIKTQNVFLYVLNEEGKPSVAWNFINAYPVKWSVSDLKSQENGILIETLELAYHYFEVKQRE